MRVHLCVIAILCALYTSASSKADETKEPPLELTLIVNGKPFPVELGQQQQLVGEFKNPSIVVNAAETRRFSYGGISFEYPASFTWEAEIKGNAYRCWTISGNDSKIMYFAVGSEFTPEGFATGMARQFGAENTSVAPVSRQFGKMTLRGKRVTATIGEVEIVQDAFAIPAPAEQWRLLVLQDVVPEHTPELAEPKRVLDLLSQSLIVQTPGRGAGN